MALLAECLVCVGDARLAEEVFEALRPHGKLNVVLGNGSLFHGNTAHFLGLLSAYADRHEEAHAYFAEALTMHERMKSIPWVVRTQVEQAELLSRTGEVERARGLARTAQTNAKALGMPRHVERATSILERSI